MDIFRIGKTGSIILASAAIALPVCLLFLLLPGTLDILAFSGQAFFTGEIWRLLSFPFVHVTESHLVENLMALIVISVLSYEFGLRGRLFFGLFIFTSLVIALLEGIFFPVIVIAGASMGIYGVLGTLSLKGSNFISKYILIPLFGLSIFGLFAFRALSCPACITQAEITQTLFHASGYAAGIFSFYFMFRVMKKPKARNFDLKL